MQILSEPAIGFDIGGSSIKAGRLETDGSRGAEATRRLDPNESGPSLVDKLAELHAELGGIGTVGIGVPGLVDHEAGRIDESPNLQYLAGFGLRDAAAARLGLAALALENDANAAAVGEHRSGGGRGQRSFLFVTLGTGVGGGLVLEDKLWRGAGLAGEIGHVKVDSKGPPCGCGSVGCLETFASATAAMRIARELGLETDLERLADLARAADGPERELFARIGRDLGLGLGAAVNLIDCRAFVFGGGFSGALDLMIPGMRAALVRSSYGARVQSEGGIALLPAELGPDAGWIGAAWLGSARR